MQSLHFHLNYISFNETTFRFEISFPSEVMLILPVCYTYKHDQQQLSMPLQPSAVELLAQYFQKKKVFELQQIDSHSGLLCSCISANLQVIYLFFALFCLRFFILRFSEICFGGKQFLNVLDISFNIFLYFSLQKLHSVAVCSNTSLWKSFAQ